MKGFRRGYLAVMDARADQQKRQELSQRQAATSTQPAKPTLNRKARRRNELFNRKLQERLAKDGTPAQVKVLDDGGLHVTVSKEELEMRHADEFTPPKEEEEA
jgi:hypothetical protein